MPYTYKFPRPAVTVDIILFKKTNITEALLIQRKNEPFKNSWAFPGGFVDKNEPLENAAKRELREETSIKNIELKQFQCFGDPGRDPRGHTVSIVFYGWVKSDVNALAGDDAADAKWFPIDQ